MNVSAASGQNITSLRLSVRFRSTSPDDDRAFERPNGEGNLPAEIKIKPPNPVPTAARSAQDLEGYV